MGKSFDLSNASTDLSLGSMGLSFYSTILQAQGASEANEYQAQKLEQAAVYGDLKADQTNGQMLRSLNTALGNMTAIRAAANADPNSPTGAAVIDNQERIGNEQRQITVDSIKQQSRQDRADAQYYRNASSRAMLSGYVSGGAQILKGLAPLIGA